MRITRYRMEYDRHDGYRIFNADPDGDAIPAKANRMGPTIRVSNNPTKAGAVTADIADCVELIDCGLTKISKSFAKNYKKALLGQCHQWVLYSVNIAKSTVMLHFVNRYTNREESLHILPPEYGYGRFRFEVEEKDGSIERYLLTISRNEDCIEERSIRLTEFHSYGRRELVFSRSVNCVEKPSDLSWEYVYVTEYCNLT